MIPAGGIIRSGGNTKYTLVIDLIGTWVFGVPLAFKRLCMETTIYWAYFILSQEEVMRLLIRAYVFHKGDWMKNLAKSADAERTPEWQKGGRLKFTIQRSHGEFKDGKASY